MSVSNDRIQNYAAYMMADDDARDALREKLELKMFRKFKTAPPEMRDEIAGLLNYGDLFFAEIAAMAANAVDLNPKPDAEKAEG